MKASQTAKESVKSKETVSQMTDQALKNYDQALRTGLRMQEEALRCWSSLMSQTAAEDGWQKPLSNFTAAANEIAPMTQRRMEEVLELVEKNSQTGTELMKKAVEAAQTPVPAESQAKWIDFWSASMGAARSNAQAMTEISAKAMDCWIEFVRQNSEVTQVRVPKAA